MTDRVLNTSPQKSLFGGTSAALPLLVTACCFSPYSGGGTNGSDHGDDDHGFYDADDFNLFGSDDFAFVSVSGGVESPGA